MPIITWEKKFSVENNTIDTQHKKLIDLINQLFDSMREGKSKDILENLLKALVDYTVYHFDEEEKMMKAVNYANYEPHIKIHETFVAKIKEFQQEYADGNSYISLEVINFLKDWILNHILVQDQQYKSVI